MIDKSREFWHGTEASDITEWLSDYIEDEKADVKPIVCHECGSRVFTMQYDEDEGAAEVKCAKCHTKKKLLDSEDYWEDAEPIAHKCPLCKGKKHEYEIAFVRRENGDVKWVYFGHRCVKCGVLASCVDWKIDYGPTDEMEQNI